MAQFTADIAGMLEIFAIAMGLVLLHRSKKEAPARLLASAGWVLVIGGVFVGACTSYYWLVYQSRGHFDGAPTTSATMMHGASTGMPPTMADGTR